MEELAAGGEWREFRPRLVIVAGADDADRARGAQASRLVRERIAGPPRAQRRFGDGEIDLDPGARVVVGRDPRSLDGRRGQRQRVDLPSVARRRRPGCAAAAGRRRAPTLAKTRARVGATMRSRSRRRPRSSWPARPGSATQPRLATLRNALRIDGAAGQSGPRIAGTSTSESSSHSSGARRARPAGGPAQVQLLPGIDSGKPASARRRQQTRVRATCPSRANAQWAGHLLTALRGESVSASNLFAPLRQRMPGAVAPAHEAIQRPGVDAATWAGRTRLKGRHPGRAGAPVRTADQFPPGRECRKWSIAKCRETLG